MSKNKGKKKKARKTHIVIILDRSGSMASIQDDVIGGFNTFLEDQKKLPNPATLTLVQFDSIDPYEVIHDTKDIQKVPKLTKDTFQPRASTPLLDALGTGMQQVGAYVKQAHKPDVVFVAITDGQENCSKEYGKPKVQRMIEERKEQGWQFVFLSSDIGAIADAESTGYDAKSVMSFDYNSKGTSNAMKSLSQQIGSYREGSAREVVFSDADRSRQASEAAR